MNSKEKEKAKELCGCCSGCTFSCGDRLNCKTEAKYNIAMKMAEWEKQQMIKKTVEWLNSNTVTMKADHCEYTASSYNLRKEKFIIAFKLAMEE